MATIVLGCAAGTQSGSDALQSADDVVSDADVVAAIDSEGSIEPCESAPVLTWANFGEGFLLDNCQACHASGAADRHGAPEQIVFDTLDDVRRWKDRIIARAGSELGGMPPAGGVSEVDRELLLAWVQCSPR